MVPKALREAQRDAADAPKKESGAGDSAGRVRLASNRETLVVRYIDQNGSVRHFLKGLRVSTKTPWGAPVPLAEYTQAMKEKLLEAKRVWNKLDCSHRQRFDDV